MTRKIFTFLGTLFFTVSLAGMAFADPTRQIDTQSTVYEDSNDSYDVTLIAQEETIAYLEGACDYTQDIDLWVYDQNDNLIQKSTTDGCVESVSIIPKWTGYFKIVVENRNKPYPTSYRLRVY